MQPRSSIEFAKLLFILYWEYELSAFRIGELLNVGKTTVLTWMKNFNIPRRS